MVVMKGQACIAGTERVMKGLLFLLVELLLPLIKLQFQITTVVCCLGNYLLFPTYFLVGRCCHVLLFLNEKEFYELACCDSIRWRQCGNEL